MQDQLSASALGLGEGPSFSEAEELLQGLAEVFLRAAPGDSADPQRPNMEARYRSLVEQIHAVVFMVYLDRGIGEAYVSPHIEATLGYSQAEWLEDPVRWYRQLHPEDSVRWSVEAAEMFLTGKPLRSIYRVIARDGHVVWFQCEAKIVRADDGHPWFIQGAAFDITELKEAEAALQEERNFISTILDTVPTLIMVLDVAGRVLHFNRACEQTTRQSFAAVRGKYAWEVFSTPDDREGFENTFHRLIEGVGTQGSFESRWIASDGVTSLISWSGSVIRDASGDIRQVIATGVDITESKRLEKAILDISAREQRRIGQDLHDGLGQHLTGIAFMSKVLQQKLTEQSPEEAASAAKIVKLVNEAISKTRELSRGLLPVVSEPRGLMSALEHWAAEVESLFGVVCRFECDPPVLIYDENIAVHLYHITQEAVNNAIKHGRARAIVIHLSPIGDCVVLNITDDGIGLPDDVADSPGMGLHIMSYRAKMIGGVLLVQRRSEGGTEVNCQVAS